MKPLARFAALSASLTAMATTIACVVFFLCIHLRNQNPSAGFPSWVTGGVTFIFFASLACWVFACIGGKDIPADQFRRFMTRQIVTFVMLLLLFLAPTFVQPIPARRSVQSFSGGSLA